MIKISIKSETPKVIEVPAGTTLYNISKQCQADFKFPILAATLNNVLANLSKKVFTDSVVEFFDRTSEVGNRVYSRSLEFLVTTSASLVLGPKSDVLVDYSLDNGIYCEVTNKTLSENIMHAIEHKMLELVQRKIPYEFVPVTKLDAMDYFEKCGQIDKVENLRYISNSTVKLHKIGTHYDYFFGPIAHDTGQTDIFKLTYLDQNSFIISYPNMKRPEDVANYIHHQKLFEEYHRYQTWSRKVNLSLSSDLNKLGTLGKYNEAINLSETHYNDQLSLVAEDINQKIDRVKLILLSGPSSSGKTTTAKKLKIHLKVRGVTVHEISLDDYFIDRDKTPKDENGNYDYANLKALDLDLFNEHMQKLLSGEEVLLPKYDFTKGKQVFANDYLKLEQGDILLIEGIHTLNDELTKYVPRENKYKIYLSPLTPLKIDNHNRVHTSDARKLRRIVRDNNFRGTSAEETLKIWPNVMKEAEDNIYPYQDDVDMIINSALNYEIGVLKIYAEPLLFAISEDSEFYPEANRLLTLLRNFLPISSELVPPDSVLREFIGGSNIDY